MRCCSTQWIKDLDTVIENLPELKALDGKTVLVTGATGLICSAVVDLILRYNKTHNGTVHVYGAGRSREKMLACFGLAEDAEDFSFVRYDAVNPSDGMNISFDYAIHGASNATPDKYMKEPVETMAGNFTGLLFLLNAAKRCNCRRLLYISSSEVYGRKEGTEPFKEDEYGFVDLLNSRSSYPVGKRAAETLCASYSDEYGVETVIVRPGHIYGPTASPSDNRVSSVWAYAAARGEDIVMKSDGSQLRSYCYSLDCASAILTALIKGENKRAYNISNPESVISIRQMAELLATSANVKLRMELPTDAERKGFNPMQNSSLDAGSLLALGWRGCFDAETGFEHTVQILKESGRC